LCLHLQIRSLSKLICHNLKCPVMHFTIVREILPGSLGWTSGPSSELSSPWASKKETFPVAELILSLKLGSWIAIADILELKKMDLCRLLKRYKMDKNEKFFGEKSPFIISRDTALQRNGGWTVWSFLGRVQKGLCPRFVGTGNAWDSLRNAPVTEKPFRCAILLKFGRSLILVLQYLTCQALEKCSCHTCCRTRFGGKAARWLSQ
jgi:hypothetical protein